MGTFVAADASSTTTSVTTLTGVTWPAHNADDVAVVGWASDNTQTRTEPPSGFTSEFTNADGSLRAIVASLDSTGSESGDVSLICGGANRQAGVIALYRGYNPSITNVTSQNETSGTGVTSHSSPSITPTDSGSAIVLIYMDRVSTSVVPSAPAGYAVRGSFATSGSGGTTVVIADKLTGLTAGVPESPAAWTSATSGTAAYVVALELVPSFTTHSADGNRSATASIDGAASIEKPASGDRSATATLSGAASLAMSAVGTLAAVAALTGAATGIKPALGDLVATVVTTGAASVAKVGAGNLSAAATLTGEADVLSGLSADGDLTATAALTGGALVIHGLTGDLATTATLTGTSEATRTASGDLTGAAVLTGAALLERSAAGDLSASATLIGEAAVAAAFVAPEEVTATVRDLASLAAPRAQFLTAAAVPAASTATARSPE